jgi:perosamine synthetase
MVGTIGDMGCFSFNGNKLITTGAGGMLVTNKDEMGDRAKFLSNQTKVVLDNKAFYHPEVGYNFRMPNLLAAFGVAQLEKVQEYLEIKRDNAFYYNEQLKDVKGIILPAEMPWAKNCFWLYSILVDEDYPISRDELIKKLGENKVEARPFFMPVHDMPPYKECRAGDMSLTNEVAAKGINLPSSVSLTKEQIDIICNIIKNV